MEIPSASALKGKKGVWWLVGGGGAILGYLWWRNQSSGSVSTDTTGTEGYDTSGDYGVSGVSGSNYGYYDPNSRTFYPDSGGSTTVTTPQNNAQWVQDAVTYLSGLGYDAITVATALGKYMLNQDLTDTDLGIVQAAIAALGYPPSPPPPPHVKPPEGQGPGTPTAKPNAPGSLHVTGTGATWIAVGWSAANGAAGYRIYLDGRHIGDTNGTGFTASGLKANSSHSIAVASYNKFGDSAKVTVSGKTTK